MKTRPHLLGAGSLVLRQGREQLDLGRRGGGAKAEIVGGVAKSAQEQRFRLARRQAVEAHPIAVDEPVAAFRAALGIDRHAGSAQRVDVAIDRAHRNLQRLGERRGGHLAARLEGGENGQEPARTHGAGL